MSAPAVMRCAMEEEKPTQLRHWSPRHASISLQPCRVARVFSSGRSSCWQPCRGQPPGALFWVQHEVSKHTPVQLH